MCSHGRPVLLATGASTMAEVEAAMQAALGLTRDVLVMQRRTRSTPRAWARRGRSGWPASVISTCAVLEKPTRGAGPESRSAFLTTPWLADGPRRRGVVRLLRGGEKHFTFDNTLEGHGPWFFH